MHKSAYGYFTFNYNRWRVFPSTRLQCYVSLSRSLVFSFSMPATRPSTRIQRRAQPTGSRRQSSRRRTPSTTTTQRQAVSVVSSVEEAPTATTSAEGAHNPSGSLNDATFQRIVSAVSEAVLATIQGTGPSAPPPSSSSAATELVEMPIVESGSALSQATVPAPVASVLHNITGEANFIQVSPSSQPALPTFHSVNVPIDANVSPKIKTKIWAHEFIDFGILLSSGAGDTRYHLSLSSPHGSSLPTLSIEPSQKPKAVPNIDAWTSAFQIFVGVYAAKFPIDAPALMKYSEVVRDLAARGADWRFYDTQFRLLRQSNPTEFPWGSTHWELWIRAQNFHNTRVSKAQTPMRHNSSTVGSLVPKGFCRKFHRGIDCSGCNFKHQCFKCGVVHPALRCNFRPPQSTLKPAPTAAKSRPTNSGSN